MIEKSTKTHYAGKIVQCLTQKQKDRFDREVVRHASFSHPRIIKLKEAVTMEGNRVIVMDLGGKSLAEVVKDLTERKVLMPRDEVYRVMEDIASALELMHNHPSGRTAHGDVKMENILIEADGHAKLCMLVSISDLLFFIEGDFGAAESEDVTATRSALSYLYTAPERLESETLKATGKADVWALGVVLYWLLFGEPPFKSQSILKLGQEISSFKVTSIKNTCGEEERALLMRMMDPNTATRVSSRQLCRGNVFRCIVNTPAGVWKLKDAENKALLRRLAEVEAKLAIEVENRQMKEKADQLAIRPTNPWKGTESIRVFDKTIHRRTAAFLIQEKKLDVGQSATAFTIPISAGMAELCIKSTGQGFQWTKLGFLRYPLPENAVRATCASHLDGSGGQFNLFNGSMWRKGKMVAPERTNKPCTEIEQTAAIRVNMSRREARLFVDDEEQPGKFTEIPAHLCLAITTGFTKEDQTVKVMWFKQ
ncbi:putative Protein kinase domain containing protein [Blattamonas nauphoetae]|uniref:non-specific serine/threonine protein kinase n=1 Tax=Blattamonas nauphoetae TaxID=2049346 RepID=A0ABQ9WXR2_9EUKA|nr:putative Protein kinase domain containing protein [Blattamonas nauphoetae]